MSSACSTWMTCLVTSGAKWSSRAKLVCRMQPCTMEYQWNSSRHQLSSWSLKLHLVRHGSNSPSLSLPQDSWQYACYQKQHSSTAQEEIQQRWTNATNPSATPDGPAELHCHGTCEAIGMDKLLQLRALPQTESKAMSIGPAKPTSTLFLLSAVLLGIGTQPLRELPKCSTSSSEGSPSKTRGRRRRKQRASSSSSSSRSAPCRARHRTPPKRSMPVLPAHGQPASASSNAINSATVIVLDPDPVTAPAFFNSEFAAFLESSEIPAEVRKWLQDNGCPSLESFCFGFEADELISNDAVLSAQLLFLHSTACSHAELLAQSTARSALFRAESKQPEAILPIKPALHQTAIDVTALRSTGRLRVVSVANIPPVQAVQSSAPVTIEQARCKTVAGQLVNLLLQHAKVSSKAGQMASCPAGLKDTLMDLYIDRWSSFSWNTLQNALTAWRRWAEWCITISLPPLPASAIHLALFLSCVKQGTLVKRKNAGGANAALNVKAGLTFLHDHLGFPFELKDEILLGATAPAKVTSPQQAEPLLFRDIVVLETLAASSENHVIQYLALMAIIQSYGCPRFKHMQRSRPLETSDQGQSFVCYQGKARKQKQTAPPFTWTIPRTGVFLPDLVALFLSVHGKIFSDPEDFLVPSWIPLRCSLSKAQGFRKARLSHGAWNQTLRELVLLGDQSWQPRPVKPPSSYSSRRFMPTISELINLPLNLRLALGSWQDNLSDDKAAAKVNAMPFRYADDSAKLSSQFEARALVIEALKRLASQTSKDDWDTLTWSTQARQLLAADKSGFPLPTGSASTQPLVALPVVRSPMKDTLLRSPAVPARSSSTSAESGSSSSSSDETDAPELEDFHDLEWCCPASGQGKLHKIHLDKLSPLGGVRPKCRVLQSEPHVGRGLHSASAQFPSLSWCGSCADDVIAFLEHQP